MIHSMSKVKVFFVISLFLISNIVYADSILDVIEWDLNVVAKDYSESYQFNVRIKNISRRKINLVGANAFFLDKLGNRILGVPLPRELYLDPEKDKNVILVYPVFDGDREARRIQSVDHNDIIVNIDLFEVLFSDGSIWKP